MKVNFQLAKYANKKNERLIICYLHDQCRQVTFSTQLNVHPDYWNQKENKVKGSTKFNYDFINWALEALKDIIEEKQDIEEIKKEWAKQKDNFSQTAYMFKDFYSSGNYEHVKVFQPKEFTQGINPDITTFDQYMLSVIERKEDGNKRDYRVCQKLVAAFDKVYLSKISHEYFKELFTKWKNNKEWTKGNFEKHKKNVKMFYNFAKNTDKLNIPLVTFKEYQILRKQQSEDSQDVALSLNYLRRLVELNDLPKHLEDTRDAIVIGIYSGGLRRSDLKRLKNIQNGITIEGKKYRFIQTKHIKTGALTQITLHEVADKFLAKHGDEIPAIINDPNFNEYVKEVMKEAKLTHKIRTQKEDLKTGNISEDYVEFWTLCDSKIARKTFCSVMIKPPYSLDIYTVMSFSGHSKVASFEAYIADSGDTDEHTAYTAMIMNDKTFNKEEKPKLRKVKLA